MGEESAWRWETIAVIIGIALPVLTVAAVVLGAPPILWIVLAVLSVMSIIWAVSHAPPIAQRLPWWVHSKSRQKTREAAEMVILREKQEQKREWDEKLRNARQRFSSAIWTSGHGFAYCGESWSVDLTLNGPPGLDPDGCVGWTASCNVRHNGDLYSATAECQGPLWFSLAYPQDFQPELTHPLPPGCYEVEWLPNFPEHAVVERNIFKIDGAGTLITRSPNSSNG